MDNLEARVRALESRVQELEGHVAGQSGQDSVAYHSPGMAIDQEKENALGRHEV